MTAFSNAEVYLKRIRETPSSQGEDTPRKKLSLGITFTTKRSFYKPDRDNWRYIFVAGGVDPLGKLWKVVAYSNSCKQFQALTEIEIGQVLEVKNYIAAVGINEIRVSDSTSFRVHPSKRVEDAAHCSTLQEAMTKRGLHFVENLVLGILSPRQTKAVFEACAGCRASGQCPLNCSCGQFVECSLTSTLRDPHSKREVPVTIGTVELQIILNMTEEQTMDVVSDPEKFAKINSFRDSTRSFNAYLSLRKENEAVRLEWLTSFSADSSTDPQTEWSDSEIDSP
jgi:hypothetical protein